MQKFCKFFATHFRKPRNKNFQRSYPQVLYLFGNLSWPLTWIWPHFIIIIFLTPLRNVNITQDFILMHHPTINLLYTTKGPTPKCYTFLETSHNPPLGSKLRCKKFAHFLQSNFMITSRRPTPTFLETSHDPRLGSKLRCKNFAHFFATLFCNQTLCSLLGDLS